MTGLSSDLTLHLSDLSPAEIAFHHNLLTLHSQSLPSFKHKLAELDRKGRHIQQIQAEMRQAAKSQARKGIATPDSKNAWSDKQIEAIKPIIANQSGRQTTAKAMRRTVYVCVCARACLIVIVYVGVCFFSPLLGLPPSTVWLPNSPICIAR